MAKGDLKKEFNDLYDESKPRWIKIYRIIVVICSFIILFFGWILIAVAAGAIVGDLDIGPYGIIILYIFSFAGSVALSLFYLSSNMMIIRTIKNIETIRNIAEKKYKCELVSDAMENNQNED